MLFFGFVQSIGSAIVFLLRKPKHNSNFILSFWFLILSLFFLGLLIPEGLVAYTKIGFVPFFLLSGPIFFFYVQSLIHINFTFRWSHLMHGIPFVLFSVLRVIYLPESMSPASYAKELNDYVKSLDETRLTTAALIFGGEEIMQMAQQYFFPTLAGQQFDAWDIAIEDPLAAIVDVAAINQYFGWYYSGFLAASAQLSPQKGRQTMLDKTQKSLFRVAGFLCFFR